MTKYNEEIILLPVQKGRICNDIPGGASQREGFLGTIHPLKTLLF